MKLILSLFQGIGMLDNGFTENGFCVVAAPEKLLSGDIRNFKGMIGKFDGIIGGSPCQDFSLLNRTPKGNSIEMLWHFCRIVNECKPNWFLLENVLQVPTVAIDGYHVQRFNLSPNDLGFEQSRNRTFQFGSLDGMILNVFDFKKSDTKQRIVLASEGKKQDRRKFDDFCKLQGFNTTPELDSFTRSAKYQAVGNGVHLGVSYVIAKAIWDVATSTNPKTIHNTKVCVCGCGRITTNKKKSATDACRKRLQKNRERALFQYNSIRDGKA
ncbi:hypothetical protein GCM10011514_02360 [Emticicia aquatilis]|uniref:DNA (cytosine-5-)-methyltransferase n=1 Tax=Emticicia aquatilis TaxID=1537369 RepID=A0A917DIQ2_9BACT|nr:DNA cytosine methyltransferase [Emticicia aquatilis]GGD41920.1 hypothetical protein GCM10011514_02360 [Emticicia aquatilis]